MKVVLKLLNIFYFNSIGIAVQEFFRFFSSQIPLDFWHLRMLRFSLYILVKLGSRVEIVSILFDVSRIIMDVGTTSSAYAKFSEKTTFLTLDTQTYVYVSGGKKCLFFRKLCVLTRWMIPNVPLTKYFIKWYVVKFQIWSILIGLISLLISRTQ